MAHLSVFLLFSSGLEKGALIAEKERKIMGKKESLSVRLFHTPLHSLQENVGFMIHG